MGCEKLFYIMERLNKINPCEQAHVFVTWSPSTQGFSNQQKKERKKKKGMKKSLLWAQFELRPQPIRNPFTRILPVRTTSSLSGPPANIWNHPNASSSRHVEPFPSKHSAGSRRLELECSSLLCSQSLSLVWLFFKLSNFLFFLSQLLLNYNFLDGRSVEIRAAGS